jgi:hypothetical protein
MPVIRDRSAPATKKPKKKKSSGTTPGPGGPSSAPKPRTAKPTSRNPKPKSKRVKVTRYEDNSVRVGRSSVSNAGESSGKKGRVRVFGPTSGSGKKGKGQKVEAILYEDGSVRVTGPRRVGVANTGEAGLDRTVTGGPRVRVFGPTSGRAASGGGEYLAPLYTKTYKKKKKLKKRKLSRITRAK